MRSPRQGRKKEPTLTERALATIRKRIVEGQLGLGEAFSESALAAEFSMSKTPVREALLQLKQEGLVDVQPQRGSFVFCMDADQVRQICDFRCTLEREALAEAMARSWGRLVDCLEPCAAGMTEALRTSDLAAYRRLDAEFHGAIIGFCGNVFLAEAYQQIAFRIQALRTRLSIHPENNFRTQHEHERIVQAIVSRTPVEATRLLTEHIEGMRDLYVDTILAGGLEEFS